MKRRFEEGGENYGGYKRNRNEDGGNNFRKRPTNGDEVDDLDEMAQLLYSFCDNNEFDMREACEFVSKTIVKNYEDESRQILKAFYACISQLSWKHEWYAILLAYISQANYDMAREIVKHLITSYEGAFDRETSSWESIRCCSRLFGSLMMVNVLSHDSIVHLITSLLQTMRETDDKDSAENIAYCVLSMLPFIGALLSAKEPGFVEKTISEIEEQFPLESAPQNLSVFSGKETVVDRIQVCLKGIKAMSENDWKSYFISSASNDEFTQNVIENQVSLDLKPFASSPIVIRRKGKPASHPSAKALFYPFNAEHDDSQPMYPEKESIDRWIVHELIWCSVAAFEINHRECVKMLMENFRLSAPFNKYRAIVETLLEDLLQVSGSSFRPVFHAVLLMDCCKAAPTTIPKELGRFIYSVYDQCDKMNFALLDRFTDWFSHHLSNFDFKWNWEDWNDCLTLDSNSAQVILVKQLLEKMVRLSYFERIETAIPESFKVLMPPPPQVKNVFPEDCIALAEKLTFALKKKASSEEILEILEKESSDGTLEENGDTRMIGNDEKRRVFLCCLFEIGSKSFSHTLNIIERNLAVLQHFCDTEENALKTITVTYEAINLNHQYFTIVMDKMTNYRLFTADTVISWALENETKLCNDYWYWQVLGKTLSKLQRSKNTALKKDIWKKLSDAFSHHENSRIQQSFQDLHFQFHGF